ncbi:MAG TPA: L-threonylcarbamoyladenylate synthase [Planctomycetia bacterium]|nr:L-threonylcarbamoyladenylate synthase [Planctomycetia bacterium]
MNIEEIPSGDPASPARTWDATGADLVPAVAAAAEVLKSGGLVAFPTETVYGLGALGLRPDCVAKVFVAKGRPATNPVILHGPSAEALRPLAACWPEIAEILAARFWPGPLTLVVDAAPVVPSIVTAGGSTVALRVPAHPVARALLDAVGEPLAAPSANRSESLSPTTAAHVLKSLAGRIDGVLDGGPTTAGLESTVVDVTGPLPRILRPGPLGFAALREVLGQIDLPFAEPPAGEPARSPGQRSRHYAPATPLHLVPRDRFADELAQQTSAGRRVGVLVFSSEDGSSAAANRVLPDDPEEFGARLYGALHDLDDAALDLILVIEPPAGEAWRAVRDRLRRAAQPAA